MKNKTLKQRTLLLILVLLNLSIQSQVSSESWAIRMAESEMQRHPGSYGSWDYQTGVILRGFEEIYKQTNNTDYYNYLKNTVDNVINSDGSIDDYSMSDYNLDEIKEGSIVLYLFQQTGEAKYSNTANTLRTQLSKHPRTSQGGFWHKNKYPYQMWLDGLYMASPFYAQYGEVFNEPAAFDDVVVQLTQMELHSRDANSGLLFHGWDESGDASWADPNTGTSPIFWGRSLGWYAMALVDVLDYLPTNHSSRQDIIDILNRLAKAISDNQDPETGVWWQVVDRIGENENFKESSSSCMFVYALAKAVRMGYIEQSYQIVAESGFEGIINEFITTNNDNTINLTSVCEGTGVGSSYTFYTTRQIQTNDSKGTGPFILAATEIEAIDNPTNTFSLVTSVIGQGSIDPASGTYAEGTTLVITATPEEGWTFSHWSGDLSSTSETITILLNSNINLTANFIQNTNSSTEITIQENETGFCEIDGTIDNRYSGYTGDGYANTANTDGAGINYKINVQEGGQYSLEIRYASRTGDKTFSIIQNNETIETNLNMPATGSWTEWITETYPITLKSGLSNLRIEASSSSGLANIDYIKITGNNLSVAQCNEDEVILYNLSTSIIGNGSIQPNEGIYSSGSVVELNAVAEDGWQFEFWSGDASGTNPLISLTMNSDLTVVANFSEIQEITNETIIQESEAGFCSLEGYIESVNTGYTGTGYSNTQNVLASGIIYQITVETEGTYTLTFRYANGSSERPAKILSNDVDIISELNMPSTGSWTSWNLISVNVNLKTGLNELRIEALSSNGLANIDYLMIDGNSISVEDCISEFKNSSSLENISETNNTLNIYPNPVSKNATLEFTLNNQENLTIRLIDLQGRIIDILAERNFSLGRNKLTFNAKKYSAGSYCIIINSESFNQSIPIIIN